MGVRSKCFRVHNVSFVIASRNRKVVVYVGVYIVPVAGPISHPA